MQLGESETLGTLYHHHRGVRHIHADLNDRRGDHYLRRPLAERPHALLLLLGRQFAVNDRQPVLR